MTTLLNNEESQKYLMDFYYDKCADKYPIFYDFLRAIVLVFDDNQNHDDWSEEEEQEIKLLGAAWIESTTSERPEEGRWYETVIQLGNRYFKFGWESCEIRPWPKYDLCFNYIRESIREVVPVQKTITVYE